MSPGLKPTFLPSFRTRTKVRVYPRSSNNRRTNSLVAAYLKSNSKSSTDSSGYAWSGFHW